MPDTFTNRPDAFTNRPDAFTYRPDSFTNMLAVTKTICCDTELVSAQSVLAKHSKHICRRVDSIGKSVMSICKNVRHIQQESQLSSFDSSERGARRQNFSRTEMITIGVVPRLNTWRNTIYLPRHILRQPNHGKEKSKHKWNRKIIWKKKRPKRVANPRIIFVWSRSRRQP